MFDYKSLDSLEESIENLKHPELQDLYRRDLEAHEKRMRDPRTNDEIKNSFDNHEDYARHLAEQNGFEEIDIGLDYALRDAWSAINTLVGGNPFMKYMIHPLSGCHVVSLRRLFKEFDINSVEDLRSRLEGPDGS